MNTAICDTCEREFNVGDDEPYQRVCDGCEQHADDYAEQRQDELRMMNTPIDLEGR